MTRYPLAIAALLIASSAAATTFRWTPDDLASLEGIAETHQRIRRAAADYCRDHLHGSRGISLKRQCVAAVTEEIVSGIDDQRLTAYVRTGKVDPALLAAR